MASGVLGFAVFVRGVLGVSMTRDKLFEPVCQRLVCEHSLGCQLAVSHFEGQSQSEEPGVRGT